MVVGEKTLSLLLSLVERTDHLLIVASEWTSGDGCSHVCVCARVCVVCVCVCCGVCVCML